MACSGLPHGDEGGARKRREKKSRLWLEPWTIFAGGKGGPVKLKRGKVVEMLNVMLGPGERRGGMERGRGSLVRFRGSGARKHAQQETRLKPG